MPRSQDPTEPIRKKAAAFPAVDKGTACNQSSFKAGKSAFLFIGPGAKGQGFKAMFKLGPSKAQAEKLAKKDPDRFAVGSTSWVTTRFTVEKPLAKAIWEKWLEESYELAVESAAPSKKKVAKKKSAKKATAKKRSAKKKASKKR